jgi:hypothetical protein
MLNSKYSYMLKGAKIMGEEYIWHIAGGGKISSEGGGGVLTDT